MSHINNKRFQSKTTNCFKHTKLKSCPKVNLTLFLQQKMNKDSENSQITSQNIFLFSPRVSLGFFDPIYPFLNEISGTTAGVGFRLSGFFPRF
jgi:hypothetical protein